MHILLHPLYFGSIEQFTAIAKATTITFEKHDNYQKQTYRNRAHIATPEGQLSLNIPIKHSSKGNRGNRERVHQKYNEVLIENDFNWQREHWKTLQIVYRSSPFFEFYEDDFAPLYQNKYTHLMQFNLAAFELLKEALGLQLTLNYTDTYQKIVPHVKDLRHLALAKNKSSFVNEPYIQVHQKYHKFLPNLSVIDLLFNEGTNALNYLQNQHL